MPTFQYRGLQPDGKTAVGELDAGGRQEAFRQMEERGLESLALYPEGRPSHEPTTGLVLDVLEGHRRHRLLSPTGVELRRFHDSLSPAAQDVLDLLHVDGAAYGVE